MFPQELAAVVQFHGIFCPWLFFGVRAAKLALREFGPHAVDEEVVAIVEPNVCGVDQLFEVQMVEPRIPAKARVLKSAQCEACGEMVMKKRVQLMGGRMVCIPQLRSWLALISIELGRNWMGDTTVC